MADEYAAPILGTYTEKNCNAFVNGYSESSPILVVYVSEFRTNILKINILLNVTIVTLVLSNIFCI